MIPPAPQRSMSQRAESSTVEVDASHSVYAAQPAWRTSSSGPWRWPRSTVVRRLGTKGTASVRISTEAEALIDRPG
jgi:hypothetical protein